jgi:hypothetical protein
MYLVELVKLDFYTRLGNKKDFIDTIQQNKEFVAFKERAREGLHPKFSRNSFGLKELCTVKRGLTHS